MRCVKEEPSLAHNHQAGLPPPHLPAPALLLPASCRLNEFVCPELARRAGLSGGSGYSREHKTVRRAEDWECQTLQAPL